MEFKEALGDARRGLNAGLKDWETPKVQLLPVDPAHSASCLKYALRYRHAQLAHAAAKTLALFAPHLLWSGMLAFAASETAMFDLGPTLAVMAAKQDKAWLRRKKGVSRVASYLINVLIKAPSSIDATHLWRLSFEQPDALPVALKTMAAQAQTVRRGMLGLLGMEMDNADSAMLLFQRLNDTPAGTLTKQTCVAAFRQFLVAPALMVPILKARSAYPSAVPTGEAKAGRTLLSSTFSSSQIQLSLTLTRDTPAGRSAIREIIASLPDLEAALIQFGLVDEDAIEVIGELLERNDEVARPQELIPISALAQSSRWSGVGITSSHEAKTLGAIMLANEPKVTAIRATHIPPSLLAYA